MLAMNLEREKFCLATANTVEGSRKPVDYSSHTRLAIVSGHLGSPGYPQKTSSLHPPASFQSHIHSTNDLHKRLFAVRGGADVIQGRLLQSDLC